MLQRNKKFAFDVVLSAVGRLGTGFITLLLMPFYIPLLGKEAFGLFGVFMTIELFFRIFEGGLVSALVKDFSLKIENENNPLSLLRSFEGAYLSLGFIQSGLCVILILSGAVGFLEAKEMSPKLIQTCLLIMAISPLFSSLTLVHTSYIQAQENIIALNIYRLILSLLSSVGAIVVLRYSGGDPVAFFSWWIICTAIVGLLKMLHCWRGQWAKMFFLKPDMTVLKSYRSDQLKLIGAGLLTFLATKYPMWIVSSRLELATVGLFTLATQIAGTLGNSISVMTKPLIARFTRDQMRDESGGLILLRMSQIMIIISGFCVVTFSLLSEDLISLWMKNSEFNPALIGVVASYLLVAKFFILVMTPYVSALQADRKLKVIYLSRFLTVLLGVPLGYLFCSLNGLAGVVATYAVTLAIVCFISFPFMVKYYPVEGGVLKKLVLPIAALILASLFIYATNYGVRDINIIYRVVIVGSLSGLLLLTFSYLGAQFIKNKLVSYYL